MDFHALYSDAASLHRKGDSCGAEQLCQQILGVEPASFAALHLLTAIRLQQGRLEEALALAGSAARSRPKDAEIHNTRGRVLQALGRPEEALASFARASALRPDYAEPLFHRATLLTASGRLQEALKACDRLLELQPQNAEAHYNRGLIFGDLRRPAQALASFEKALAIRPDFPEAWNNRGFTMQLLKRPEEALASFDTALAIQPENAEAWVNRGVALRGLERHEEALASFDRALAIAPEFAQAWNNRGFILQHLGRLDEALSSFETCLRIHPIHAEALLNLGSVLCEAGRVDEGFAAFTRHAELVYGDPGAVACGGEAAPPHKKRHDREQRDYLAAAGVGSRGAGLQLTGGDRLSAPTINGGVAAEQAAEQWRRNAPQVVVIDDLLTEDALEGLRRFCWGSRMWRRVYDEGYVGAMPEHGFAAPLLAQIARELRERLPDILGSHPLRYLWAFKYDSRLSGIKVHADRAAVNVNFWITPDEANLEPDSGGLVVWDLAAPLDWDFERYNGDPEAIRTFLEQAGARSLTVPYRANRAVIFDSDLFHQTDRIRFKDGYRNRRINVTMLYGRRSSENR